MIGAGGNFCPVAKLFRKSGPARIIAAQETEFLLDRDQSSECKIEPEVPEIYFCEDLKGYGWCVRKKNWLNIGLGRRDPHELSAHVKSFLRFLNESGRVSFDVTSKFNGHAYLTAAPQGKTHLPQGILLIGDSLGLASPESGEGIWPAVRSALLAAGAVEKANGTYSKEILSGIQESIDQEFASRPDGTKWLPAWLKQKAASVMLGNTAFCRDVVVKKWFLHSSSRAS